MALTALLAVAPLLPTGPIYAGFPPFAYVDLALAPLVLLWAIGRIQARGRAAHPWPLALSAWHFTIAAVLGAAVFGLMAENRLDSPVFLATLGGAADLLRPMNQAVHPLHPLRVALTFVEGWLVFLLVADLCRRAADPRRWAAAALDGWLLGFVLVSVFALLQYVTRFQLHPYWVKANPHIVRAHSTLDDPNALGAYLVLGIGLIIGWLYLAEARRRSLWIALLALGVAGLATTMSRAALGAAVLGPLGVLAFVPRAVTRWQHAVRTAGRVTIAAMIVVVLGSAAFRMFTAQRTRTQPTNQAELVLKTLDPRESTDWVLRGRLAWWQAAVGMFRDHPLTGVGLGRFPRLLAEFGGGRSQENTHNLFLQLLAEAGAPGAVAFAALCISQCLAFRRKLRDGPDPYARAMALGGLIATVAFLMTLMTGHTLLVASGQILWASFIALAAGLATWSRRPEAGVTSASPSHSSSMRAHQLTAAALALALWYPVTAFVQGVAPQTGDWGYAWGLFPEEQAGGGGSYRWTSGRAMLDLSVPAGATAIELPVAAPSPIRDDEAVRVGIAAGEWTHEFVLSTPDVYSVRIPLDRGRADRAVRVLIDLQVRPTFVPSRERPQSGDRRVLGIQLLRPRFVIGGRTTAPE